MYLAVSRYFNHQTSSINAVTSTISTMFRQFFIPPYMCMCVNEGEGLSAILSVAVVYFAFKCRCAGGKTFSDFSFVVQKLALGPLKVLLQHVKVDTVEVINSKLLEKQ